MSKTALSMLGSLLLSTALAAPAATAPAKHPPGRGTLPHYVLFDVGSFGGGAGQFCYLACREINRHGHAVGIDATALADPFDPICFFDCHVDHSFLWKNGGTNDIGSLQYGLSSFATGVNDKDSASGISQNGRIDPDTGIFEGRAVVWNNGRIRDLGTLGGTQSAGSAINNSNQAPVISSNSDSGDPYINIPQSNCLWLPTTGGGCSQNDFGTNALFLPVTTATHVAEWQPGAGLADLGTLGGPDSAGLDINDNGQIVGWSYTSYTAGGAGVPDTHPFLWDNGTMIDLIGLGGTFGAGVMVNNSGVVAGAANLPGDTEVHPFLWDKENGIRDLGTLGGTYAHPDWLNENGDVVGFSRNANHDGRAFYWHDGTMTDLGTLDDDPASEATGINNHGIIVGLTFNPGVEDLRGFVSNQGGQIVDLNSLIRKSYGLHVIAANAINDRGVITANATTRKGELHPVILVPENDFDMLAQMNAAMHDAAKHASASAGPMHSHVRKQGCASRDLRLLPHFCRER